MKNVELNNSKQRVVCIAGFGDNSTMFSGLLNTVESNSVEFVPLDLPGFGAAPLVETNLTTLAEFVLEECRQRCAKSLMAHSVASIIASLAAEKSSGDIENIISLEGNLTAEDAYFSGTAADFDNPDRFRAVFLERLSSNDDPVIAAYRDRVALADTDALWLLGCDARKYSTDQFPGDTLMKAARALYLHNPENCPRASIEWLKASGMENVVLKGASHWPTIDQPSKVADIAMRFLAS